MAPDRRTFSNVGSGRRAGGSFLQRKPTEREGKEGKEERSGQGTEGERDNARGEPEGEDAGVGMGREEGRYCPLFIANVLCWRWGMLRGRKDMRLVGINIRLKGIKNESKG